MDFADVEQLGHAARRRPAIAGDQDLPPEPQPREVGHGFPGVRPRFVRQQHPAEKPRATRHAGDGTVMARRRGNRNPELLEQRRATQRQNLLAPTGDDAQTAGFLDICEHQTLLVLDQMSERTADGMAARRAEIACDLDKLLQ